MNESNDRVRGLWAWNLVFFIVGSALIFLSFLIVLEEGWNEEALRQTIRWSARISFTLFCIAFATSGIHHIWKNVFTFWLRMNRKYIGISFALIHLIHFILLIFLQMFFHPVFELARTGSLIGGGIAYAFVIFMLLTSFSHFVKRMSTMQWKYLHTVGGYWIWSIFMTSYYKRALTEPIHWIVVTVLVIVLIFRLNKRIKFIPMKVRVK